MKTYTLLVFVVGSLVTQFFYALQPPMLPTEMLAIIAGAMALTIVAAWIHNPNRSPRSTGEVYDPKDESDLPGWEMKP